MRLKHKLLISDTGQEMRHDLCFTFCMRCLLGLRASCRKTIKTNMSSSAAVHVRICGQEIIKYDLEIKALIQVGALNEFLPLSFY